MIPPAWRIVKRVGSGISPMAVQTIGLTGARRTGALEDFRRYTVGCFRGGGLRLGDGEIADGSRLRGFVQQVCGARDERRRRRDAGGEPAVVLDKRRLLAGARDAGLFPSARRGLQEADGVAEGALRDADIDRRMASSNSACSSP